MTLINNIQQAIKATNFKHQMFVENIANVSKPGFKSKHFSENQNGFSASLAVNLTNNKHLAGTKQDQKFKVSSERHSKHLKPNGNDVYLPDQMLYMSQNQMEQQKLLKIYTHLEDLFRVALGK